MKVKVINRNEEEYTRERSQDLRKVHKNLDPNLHPFEKAVEYTRALNAAKLDRVFAKPFLASLPHDDGITCLSRNPRRLNSLVSGCADGELRIWDVAAQRPLRNLLGHTSEVKGVSITQDGDACVSCSTDCTVKLWKVPFAPDEAGPLLQNDRPVFEFRGKGAFRGIDHHWGRNSFATAGPQVDIWDRERSEPVNSFTWGADSIMSVRFNPVSFFGDAAAALKTLINSEAEADVMATAGSDRGIALYDLRTSTPIRKLIMQTKTNSIAWNPMEAFNFTAANEDCCLYTYDMRKLQSATCVHKDFVSAVMDVDYSPTGREFVAGSYDRSVRIFSHNGGHSKEVYHTKRMQRIFAVRFSGDGSYVFSGSDDMNVRLWKAQSSVQMGTLLPRERQKHEYQQALVERYKHLPDVKRISRHRHLPTPIYKAAKLRRTMTEADNKKQHNRIAHSAPGSVKVKSARKKKVVAELE